MLPSGTTDKQYLACVDEHLDERLIEPLGLEHTGYSGEPSASRIGHGHVAEGGKFVEATTRWHPSIGGAAGGMYSTTANLMAFTLALFEGDLLDAKRMAEMRTFVAGEDYGYVHHAYGLGLERYTVNNLTVLGHMGTGCAHSAFIGYDPTSRVAVAVQINAANPGPAAIMGAEVLGEVAGKDISPPPMPSRPPSPVAGGAGLSAFLSSMIRLSPTTSVANFLWPSLSSQLRVRNRPSIYTRLLL